MKAYEVTARPPDDRGPHTWMPDHEGCGVTVNRGTLTVGDIVWSLFARSVVSDLKAKGWRDVHLFEYGTHRSGSFEREYRTELPT